MSQQQHQEKRRSPAGSEPVVRPLRSVCDRTVLPDSNGFICSCVFSSCLLSSLEPGRRNPSVAHTRPPSRRGRPSCQIPVQFPALVRFGPEIRACPPSCPCAQPQGTNPGQRPPVPDTSQQQRQGALRCCARQARTRTSRASGAALRLGAVHPTLAVHEQPAAPWSPPDQAGARPVCKMRPE